MYCLGRGSNDWPWKAIFQVPLSFLNTRSCPWYSERQEPMCQLSICHLLNPPLFGIGLEAWKQTHNKTAKGDKLANTERGCVYTVCDLLLYLRHWLRPRRTTRWYMDGVGRSPRRSASLGRSPASCTAGRGPGSLHTHKQRFHRCDYAQLHTYYEHLDFKSFAAFLYCRNPALKSSCWHVVETR